MGGTSGGAGASASAPAAHGSVFNPSDRKFRACCCHTKSFTLAFGVVEIFIICFLLISVMPDFNTKICSQSLPLTLNTTPGTTLTPISIQMSESNTLEKQLQEQRQLMLAHQQLLLQHQQLEQQMQQQSQPQQQQQQQQETFPLVLPETTLSATNVLVPNSELQNASSNVNIPSKTNSSSSWQMEHELKTFDATKVDRRRRQMDAATTAANEKTLSPAVAADEKVAAGHEISDGPQPVNIQSMISSGEMENIPRSDFTENLGISIIHEISCSMNLVWIIWAIVQIIMVNVMFYGIKNLKYKLFIPHIFLRCLCFFACVLFIILLVMSAISVPLPNSLSVGGIVALIIFIAHVGAWLLFLIKNEIRCCEFVKRSADTGFSMSNTRPLGPPTASLSETMARQPSAPPITNTLEVRARHATNGYHNYNENSASSYGRNENAMVLYDNRSRVDHQTKFASIPQISTDGKSDDDFAPPLPSTTSINQANIGSVGHAYQIPRPLVGAQETSFRQITNDRRTNLGNESLNVRRNVALPPLRHTYRPR